MMEDEEFSDYEDEEDEYLVTDEDESIDFLDIEDFLDEDEDLPD